MTSNKSVCIKANKAPKLYNCSAARNVIKEKPQKAYNVLVGRSGMKSDKTCFTIAPILLDSICRSFYFVHQIRIEDVELITLYNFRGRIIMVIMCLVIFIPFISSVHSVEVLGLSRTIFIMPPINLKSHISC